MLAIVIFCIITGILIYYQVFTQGLFSSLIMAVWSLVAAVVALNYHELLAAMINDQLPLGNFGPRGISLMLIFLVTLFALRGMSDRFVRGNMNFPLMVDRMGSAAFALVSSLTITGMLALTLQSLPVSATFLGFDRCEKLTNPEEDKSLFPCGDSLVLTFMNRVSSYCFAGSEIFANHHPDMLREMYMGRLVPEDHQGSRKEAASNAMSIERAWVVTNDFRELDRKPSDTLLGVKLKFASGSDKTGDYGAQDVDNAIRFAMGHIRMVGYSDSNQDRNATGCSVYPVGLLAENSTSYTPISLEKGKYFTGGQAQITLLFKWPDSIKKVPPRYIEFKRSARAEMPTAKQILEDRG